MSHGSDDSSAMKQENWEGKVRIQPSVKLHNHTPEIADNFARVTIAVHQVQGYWEGKVRIELSVMLHEQTPAIKQFLVQLPDWTTSTGFTVFQKSLVL